MKNGNECLSFCETFIEIYEIIIFLFFFTNENTLKIEMFYFGIHAESPITPILDHI
jgi:hypothetical protein